MKRKIVLAAAFFTFNSQAFGQTQARSNAATIFGMGSSSCASAFTPQKNFQSTAWVMGFWSGLNASANADGKNAAVGQSTDGIGIIREVELYCSGNPSLPLGAATFEIYEQLRRLGR